MTKRQSTKCIPSVNWDTSIHSSTGNMSDSSTLNFFLHLPISVCRSFPLVVLNSSQDYLRFRNKKGRVERWRVTFYHIRTSSPFNIQCMDPHPRYRPTRLPLWSWWSKIKGDKKGCPPSLRRLWSSRSVIGGKEEKRVEEWGRRHDRRKGEG